MLNAAGLYQRHARDEQDRLTSPILPGFVLDTMLLWEEPKPTTGQTLRLVADMLGVSVETLLK